MFLAKKYRRFTALLAFLLSAPALSISLHASANPNISVVNVTPASFSVIWRATRGATPDILVYADAAGSTSLNGKIRIEKFPLHSGNPELAAAYDRRQNVAALRQKTQSVGLMHVKVSECQPQTTYFFKLRTLGAAGEETVWPDDGSLFSVATAAETSFVAHSKQLIVEVPGSDVSGLIITVGHTNAAHSLAAVVGDGAAPNQAFFNLSDLIAQVGGTNYIPVGEQKFRVSTIGATPPDQHQNFAILFRAEFTVSETELRSAMPEWVFVGLGRTVLRAGDSGEIAVHVVSTVSLASLAFEFELPENRLEAVGLQKIAPEVGTASLQTLSPGHYRAVLTAAAGDFIQGTRTNLARLTFTCASGQNSALVNPVTGNVLATRSDAILVAKPYVRPGKIVIVADQPLVDAEFSEAGERTLAVYGQPHFDYVVQRATGTLDGPWQDWQQVHIDSSLQHLFAGLTAESGIVFYRARQGVLYETPEIEVAARQGQSLALRLRGLKNRAYDIETASNLSPPVQWMPLLTITLNDDPVQEVGGMEITGDQSFFRLKLRQQ
jgi:hypothetical protein